MIDTSQGPFSGKILSETIKAGSILASMAAIVYLYGFGLSARVNMLAYVSFTDYLRVAVGWIVPALVPAFLSYLVPDITKAVRQSKETEPRSSSPLCEFERRMKRDFNVTLAVLALSVMILVGVVLVGMDLKVIFRTAALVGVTGWMTAYGWFAKSAENVIRLGREKSRLMLLVPPLLIFSLGWGLAHGAIAEKTSSSTCDFVVVGVEEDSPIYGELLFSFDKFVIIRESGHTELTFLPSDKVTSIRMPVSIPPSAPRPQAHKQ